MRQPPELRQRIQVCQFGKVVGCEYKSCKVWDRVVKRRLDAGDSVAGTEQRV